MGRICKSTTAAMMFAISLGASGAKAAESYFPECFAAWDADTKQLSAVTPREGPYRIALVNGFAGNDWRIQMIRAAESYAKRPEIAAKIKEFTAVSVGNDVAAQIAAIENYVAAGYDAVLFIAVNPEAFDAVIGRANQAGTLLVSFDNVVFNDNHLIVDIDHGEIAAKKAQAILDNLKAKNVADGKVLWVRGLQGNATEKQQTESFRKVFEGTPFEVVEVVGNWDVGTSQRVTAEAVAAHGKFVGVANAYGSMGSIQALLDAKHPAVPFGSDTMNGAVQMLAENGFTGVAIGSSPSVSAVAILAALSTFEGKQMPQRIKLPPPSLPSTDWKDGVAYFSQLPASFDTATGFKECDLLFTADELTSK
jgi:ribose transport system substrate-binding protein